MTSINTNQPSLRGQHHLSRNQASLSTAMERLTSGMRMNGAKDDVAGQAIANRMMANLRGNDAVTRGINDAISLLQTAEGGLNGINDLLQRAQSLAVQAANGTLSDANRAAINGEYGELRADIDRIALRTEVFGKHLLAPAESRDQGPSQPADRPSKLQLARLVSLAKSLARLGGKVVDANQQPITKAGFKSVISGKAKI